MIDATMSVLPSPATFEVHHLFERPQLGVAAASLIHHAFSYARWLRIGDGPDEVHLRQIFRSEPVPEWTIADCPYIAPPTD